MTSARCLPKRKAPSDKENETEMIHFQEKEIGGGRRLRLFTLETPHTSYIFGVMGDDQLVHVYYGKKIRGVTSFDPWKKLPLFYLGQSPRREDVPGWQEVTPYDFSTFGAPDLRLPTLHLRYADGMTAARFAYKTHKIYPGKPKLEGLPATYAETDGEAMTLEIVLRDALHDAEVTLLYTVFAGHDAVVRSMRVTNTGASPLVIERAMSATVDFAASGASFDFLHLDGAWGRERSIVRDPLGRGVREVSSRRGISSAVHNPFFALMEKNADELHGRVYGFNLIYSGNFVAGTEVDTVDNVRAYIGLDDFSFSWRLEAGESFQTPEAVAVFSDEGLSGMSRVYHRLYRTRLCRGLWRDTERYALINNWEGTAFEFDEQKILAIAAKGKEIGLDLMVLDDGWFKGRDSDKAGLGDWIPDETKLPHGITGLAERVEALGMKFGLWFEPEMVSPDSDLYRAHPDWAMHVNGMSSSLGRNQLMLDLTRDDVCDYIVKSVSDILETAHVSYVKWDCNRCFSEAASDVLSSERAGEFAHRYTLGLYRVMETLTERFPDVLFEGCSSGGGRYDGGILYYMPQIWTSDCTDAVERIAIEYGTSVVYPFNTMGAHVSASPNQQTGRASSMKSRGDLSLPGQFGFELDAASMSEAEIDEARKCLDRYRKYGELLHKADLYRLRSPFEGNEAVLEFLSEDKETVIVLFEKRFCELSAPGKRVRLAGLDPDADYEIVFADKQGFTGLVYGGDELMENGLFLQGGHDGETMLFVFKKHETPVKR